MASRPANVGIRLGMDGKEEVKSGFAEVGAAGDAAARRASEAFTRESGVIEAATKRQADAAQKLAAIGVKTGPNNNQQVLDYRAFTKEMADQQRQAEALRDVLEPLRVAERTYGDEIDRLRKLQASGKITGEEYAAGLRLANSGLQDAKRNLEEHSSAMGFNRTQTMIAQSAVMRFSDSLIAGQSPIRAFALEAHKIGEVAAFDEGGVAGALEKVRAVVTPTGLAIAAATALVIAGTAAWGSYAEAVLKLNAITGASGAAIGVTGRQLEENAEAAASAGDITVKSARDIESAYVQTGKIGGEVLGGLTAVTADFAAGTGMKLDQAKEALARAFADPAKGADELTAQYGILDAKTVDYIHTLVEQGRQWEAQQVLLKGVQDGFDGAAKHAKLFADAFDLIKIGASEAYTWVGKLIDKMITGGSVAERLASLQAQRARAKSDSYGLADTSALDAEIAGLQKQLAAEQTKTRDAQAHSRAAAGLKAVDAYTGDDKKGELQAQLASVNAVLAPGAGASAEQLKNAREAQDAYTRAIESYLPPAEKKRQLDALDAQIAAAKTPAQKAALASQREEVELAGQVVTRAQASADAHAKGAQALATASKAGAGHAATLERDAQSMEVNAREALKLADAYLQGGAAAIVAEARRKALTDATKKGIDVEAEARRQLALTIAEAIATGAKATRGAEDESSARAQVIAAVMGGKLAVSQISNALADEAALRGEKTLLQVPMETELRKKLTDEIERHTKALNDNHIAAEKIAALSATQSARDNIAALRDQMEFAGDRTGAGAIEQARRQAEREAAKSYPDLDPNDSVRTDLVNSQVDAARTKVEADRKKYTADTLNSQKDQLKYSQAELATIGMGNDARQIALDKIKKTIELQAEGVDLESDDAKEILAGVEAQDRLTQAIAASAAAMDEVRSFGSDLVDDLAKGGNLAKDLEQEFIKLAALNPLKNLINGDSKLPTLGSLFGNIGKIFGGGSTDATALPNGVPLPSIIPDDGVGAYFTSSLLSGLKIPGFATGTDSAPGGAAWVAENGPELINLPKGASVTPAPQTKQLLSAANNNTPASIHVTVGLDDDMLTARVSSVSDGRIAMHAPAIAMGGAQLAAADAAKRRRYRIPGR